MLTYQGIALLVVAAVLLAAILRAARCPGWPVVGGIVAGAIIGATVLGRAMPDTFQRLFVGGIDQQKEVEELQRERELQQQVMLEAGASKENMDAAARDHARRLARAESNRGDARWADQRPLRWFTFGLVALVLGAAGTLGVRPGEHGHHPLTSISIGAWSAALPGVLTVAIATWFGFPLVDQLIAASAVSVGAWTLLSADRDAADQAELGGGHMIQTATRVASVLSLSALAWAIFLSSGLAGLRWLIPLAALPVGWMLPAPAGRPGPIWRAMRFVVSRAAVPTLAAACAIKVDFIDHFSIWLVLLMILFSGDGRMFGAFIGAKVVAPRHSLRALRMVVGVMAAGPTQLAVLAVALHTANIDEELAAALILGAMAVELFTPMRKAFAHRVVELESEIEEREAELDRGE